MTHAFDEMAKELAQSVSRREAIRRVTGGVFGVLLASLGLPTAQAAGRRAGQSCVCCCNGVRPRPHPFGRCVSDCVAGRGVCGCAPGLTLCSGGCVDLSRDNGNCGACGTVCGGGRICVSGQCVGGSGGGGNG